jgi:hypothetical protein
LLLALGFVKKDESEIYDFRESGFSYHLGVKRVLIFHPGNSFKHWLGTHINNVHQIQNLFYCLIGHDLTLQEGWETCTLYK